MLLDLSVRPLLVIPHEVKGHLVVRTLGTSRVTGLVTQQVYGQNGKYRVYSEEVGARLRRGQMECLETRIRPRFDYDPLQDLYRIPVDGRPEPRRAPTPILRDPYEVGTAYRDPVTGTFGEWRLSIQLEARPTGTWLVTVSRVGGEPLLCVAVPQLDPYVSECDFPLSRVVGSINEIEPETAWSRLVDDDP